MAFIPVPNTCELLVIGSWVGQEIVTTFNFKFPSPITIGQMTAMAIQGVLSWQDHIMPQTSEKYGLTSVKCTDISSATGSVGQSFPGAPISGTVGGPSVNLNAAMVISEHTLLRGRSYRGRIYVPGIPQSDLANAGQMGDGARIAVIDAYTDFINDLEIAYSCVHVVVSRQQNNVPLTTGIATEIETYSANVDLDSQRRRLVGRGS